MPTPTPPKRPLPFSDREYALRLAAVRQSMDARGLSALIVTDPANIAWLTGYEGHSFYVHQAVVVTLDDAPRWWGRPMDAVGARMTVWMSDTQIFEYSDDHVQNPEKHPYVDLVERLREWGLAESAIGVELDNYYFTAACVAELMSGVRRARIHDATGLVNWRRLVKSDAEIALMRRAARIVSNAHAMIAERIAPGLRKSALVADVYHALIDGAEDSDGPYGGDYPSIAVMAPSGAQAAAAHLTWDDAPFVAGEATFFEIAGCVGRYHCPQSRTFSVGPPSQALRDAEAIAVEGLDAAIAAASPGRRAEEVEGAWRAVLAKHGREKESRIGYSVGLAYPPDWGERTLSLRPGDDTELLPGMTIHVIPAIWDQDQGFGLEITETVLIGENGAEPLCDTPRRLFETS